MKSRDISIDLNDVSLQLAECRTLSNGIKHYSLSGDEFEVLRVSFVFGAGSIRQQKPFTASATAYLMAEGSETMDAHQIAESLDFYGSHYDVNVDRDYTYFNICMLSKFAEQTLAIAEQILIHPIFPEHEVQTYCAKRKQRLTIEREKVETRAREEFARSLFGAEHPYGISSHQDEYDKLTRDDVVNVFKNLYTAQNCTVVSSGKVGDRERELIEQLAEMIPQGEALQAVDLPAIVSRPWHVVELPNAVQSSIRIGARLFTRTHPDFLAMQLLATTLGGYFGSRLMRSLREERGLTYGVMSAMVNFAHAGYFAVATQVNGEATREAIELIKTEIERLRSEPIPEDELEMVRRIMIGEIMRILDGPFGIADVTIETIMCGLDNSMIENNVERIMNYTPEELLDVAQRYLNTEDMVYVVAGSVDAPFV